MIRALRMLVMVNGKGNRADVQVIASVLMVQVLFRNSSGYHSTSSTGTILVEVVGGVKQLRDRLPMTGTGLWDWMCFQVCLV